MIEMTERQRIEEEKRQQARDRMAEERFKQNCLYRLQIGSMQECQIDEWMVNACISKPVAEKLAMEVRSAYAENPTF